MTTYRNTITYSTYGYPDMRELTDAERFEAETDIYGAIAQLGDRDDPDGIIRSTAMAILDGDASLDDIAARWLRDGDPDDVLHRWHEGLTDLDHAMTGALIGAQARWPLSDDDLEDVSGIGEATAILLCYRRPGGESLASGIIRA
ncbi:hypothetical protein FYJ43_04275 [Cutibacterium sp. WCA-380-WT-3A]|uniref:Uncharacterized protein n=1 Tax=Cutibacterium porci TaxID=2605781 RepID=A0A7K0J5U2_9ACTN|nr:hypothetical protein [Cutibacterium porci]MSS45273.1 hypothetical protein [Cutibacterium porci]